MSKTRMAEDEAVPLARRTSEAAPFLPREEDGSTTELQEKPVPLRLGTDRIEAEERAARLRMVTGRRPRWR
jgi:hypothetical protein